jgi:hypothetical protein
MLNLDFSERLVLAGYLGIYQIQEEEFSEALKIVLKKKIQKKKEKNHYSETLVVI